MPPPYPAGRGFNTQPPEGGWKAVRKNDRSGRRFNTQPPEGGWLTARRYSTVHCVSTHSRPKAAGAALVIIPNAGMFQHTAARRRLGEFLAYANAELSFNTQPPEGGWPLPPNDENGKDDLFQHTAARRRLGFGSTSRQTPKRFQHTAARRRLESAAALPPATSCFNTQPPEGGWFYNVGHSKPRERVSTHSRPKAAGGIQGAGCRHRRCFNTQPPEGGWANPRSSVSESALFQHTAARRRLGFGSFSSNVAEAVSTHSRPKAAGLGLNKTPVRITVSTHSRPKAAGMAAFALKFHAGVSTHSRPKAAGWQNITA